MRSGRDQLQAYQFLSRRVVAALVTGDVDGRGAPVHRAVRTTFVGAMLAAVIVAGVGIYGLIRPGGAKAWAKQDGVVIEKETGAGYVWHDGRLHPMINFSSARLFVGGGADGTPVARVSRRSLAGVPRAEPRGITGAPDSLPEPRGLASGPWTVCASGAPATPDGRGGTSTALLVDHAPTRGSLGADDALLVRAGDESTVWLVWRRTRARLDDLRLALPLGLGDRTPRTVAPAWLNALPQVGDIAFPEVPGRGSPGPLIDGRATRVGQLLVARTPVGDRHALVRREGVLPVTSLVAALVRTDSASREAYDGKAVTEVEVPADALAAARQAPPDLALDSYPARALNRVDNDRDRQVLCVTLHPRADGVGPVDVSAVDALPAVAAQAVDAAQPGGDRADRVAVRPGTVALVKEEPQPGVPTGTRFLVTDAGRRHAVVDDEAMSALGYEGATVLRLPPGMLRLLPAGPELSRAAAAAPARPSDPPSGQS